MVGPPRPPPPPASLAFGSWDQETWRKMCKVLISFSVQHQLKLQNVGFESKARNGSPHWGMARLWLGAFTLQTCGQQGACWQSCCWDSPSFLETVVWTSWWKLLKSWAHQHENKYARWTQTTRSSSSPLIKAHPWSKVGGIIHCLRCQGAFSVWTQWTTEHLVHRKQGSQPTWKMSFTFASEGKVREFE